MRGLFIALEGPDGSGKSTMVRMVGDYLKKEKINYLTSREPGGTDIGEDIRKENVVPRGNPAEVKPINIGILEQEQNGVTVPSKAPNIFPLIPPNLPNVFLVFSGGKYDWIYDIPYINTPSKINILIVSYMKK